MSLTTTMVFRYDKVNDNGIGPIYLRLTKNRKVSYISTGKRIHEKFWDKHASKVKTSYPNSTQLNNYLTKLLLQYEEQLLKEESTSFDASLKALKGKVTGKDNVDFFSLSQTLIERYYAAGKTSTYRRTNSIVMKLKGFCKGPLLLLSDITPKFLSDYELHLRKQHGNQTNSIHRDMDFIKRVFNEAYRLGIIEYSQNPFTKYKIKREKTYRSYLTAQEVDALEAVPCISKLKVAKDMFIFSAYTGGMRISDVLLLQCKNFDGTYVSFQIQKTAGQLSIKLPNKALSILSEYVASKKSNEFIFPMMPSGLDLHNPWAVSLAISRASASINKYLKTLAALAGIPKNISFHIARHTWATLALKKGISLDKVSKLMGHASVKETQIYAKIVSEELDKAMEAFN